MYELLFFFVMTKLFLMQIPPGYKIMASNSKFGLTDINKIFLIILIYRIIMILVAMVTLRFRQTLPEPMIEWFRFISYPLLVYGLLLILLHKIVSGWLQRYPALMLIDLFIGIAILQIGGAWRSSYFGYTFSTIIVFTVFGGKKGAYFSMTMLILTALIKDPTGRLPSLETFFTPNWDMRLGAASFYLVAGLILAYFHTLMQRLEMLSKAEVEKTRKLTQIEEKNRMAFELHDGVKQMVTAMLLKMNPILKNIQSSKDEMAEDLRWLWKGMNYLKNDLNEVMLNLKEDISQESIQCDLVNIAEEEKQLAEVMTGFSWRLLTSLSGLTIPHNLTQNFRRFLSETFINAWKHSGVKEGVIKIENRNGFTAVIIEDQGNGFDYDGNRKLSTSGLNSLKYRSQELGGTLTIKSKPCQGCRITLVLPEFDD